MPSPSVTVRLSEDTHQALVKLAEMENKNLAQFTRELIEQALGKHLSAEETILNEIRMMHMQLGDLLAKAAFAAAGNQQYNKLITEYVMDIANYLPTGQAMSAEAKRKQMEEYQEKVKQQAHQFLREGWEKL